MLVSTKDIKVVVITERWSKGYRRDDGTEVPEGWTKPRGWPARASQQKDGDINSFKRWDRQAYHECSLYQALTHHASSPAYFVGYRPTNIGLRLRKDCLNFLHSQFTEDAGGVHMHLALLDVDNHEEDADIEAWWELELEKIEKLLELYPGIIVYRSRRGYRLIGLLPEIVTIKTQQDSNQWDRRYTAWCNYLTRRFNIKADVLLDWTRFQAVPHTKKEKDQPALDLEIIGNVEQIGFWSPELSESDWPPEKQVAGDYDGVGYEGECQLLQLVQRAGLRCEETEYPSVYDICCPNWTSHSPDSRGLQDYPTKTVLYANGPIGKIECKSSGCRSSHPDRSKDYLRHFRPQDVEATRPKPPVDVWDHDVLILSNYRNACCDKVNLDAYLQLTVLSDDTYLTYQSALSIQTRLKRKNDSGPGPELSPPVF